MSLPCLLMLLLFFITSCRCHPCTSWNGYADRHSRIGITLSIANACANGWPMICIAGASELEQDVRPCALFSLQLRDDLSVIGIGSLPRISGNHLVGWSLHEMTMLCLRRHHKVEVSSNSSTQHTCANILPKLFKSSASRFSWSRQFDIASMEDQVPSTSKSLETRCEKGQTRARSTWSRWVKKMPAPTCLCDNPLLCILGATLRQSPVRMTLAPPSEIERALKLLREAQRPLLVRFSLRY